MKGPMHTCFPFLHSSQWLVTAAVLIYFRNVFKGDNGLGGRSERGTHT